MRAFFRNFHSITLAVVWTLCILHGFVDNATAHWHVQESGKVHHHHHPFDAPQEHDHGEPLQGHSDTTEGADLCEAAARVSNSIQLEKSAPVFEKRGFWIQEIFALVSLDAPLRKPQTTVSNQEELPSTDLAARIMSLLAPNAPPARLLF